MMIGLSEVGGPSALWAQLESIDPGLVSFTPSSAPFGFAMFALGWLAAGFGACGQPHIMVRAMTLDSPQNIPVARRVYVTWNILFAIAAIGVGLLARVLLGESPGFDPELAMPTLAMELLPPVLVGLVLAGLFAATMSTADSQVLSCSAAITKDIAPLRKSDYRYTRLGTILVTAIMLGVALGEGNTVFGLVTMAWSILAASLGPLLVVQAFERPPRTGIAVAMMVGGMAVAWGWKNQLNYGAGLCEALPGMLTGVAIYFIGNAVFGRPDPTENS
jgi:sodium/proline symporter